MPKILKQILNNNNLNKIMEIHIFAMDPNQELQLNILINQLKKEMNQDLMLKQRIFKNIKIQNLN